MKFSETIKKIVIVWAVILIVASPLLARYSGENDIISIQKTPDVIKALRGMNLDILFQEKEKIYIIAGIQDLIKLQETGIAYSLETHRFAGQSAQSPAAQGGINGDYHSYLELEQDLFLLESSFPQLAKVQTIGTSHEQRQLYALKISARVHQEENEAKIILLGCHHAREWISVEVPYLIGKHLLENYASDSEIRSLLNQSEVWIIPLVNPDGLVYSIYTYRYWRKNRRNNGDGSYGVDPNRNYGYKWGCDNIGSSPDSYSSVYRGSAPFSEPETQAVRDFVTGKNFQVLVTYHNYSQIILYPWGYTEDPSPLNDLMHDMAEHMAAKMEEVNGTSYEFGGAADSLYLTNGDTTDWILGVFGVPSFTIELPPVDILSGGFYNSEQDIIPIFQENLPAVLYLIDWAIEEHSLTAPHPPPVKPEPLRNKSREVIKK
jgi:murein tripeptide amidase MpaA